MTELDPRTSRVIRDLAKTQHDLKRQVARLNRGQDAGRTTIHHGALQVADQDGKVTHKLGQKGLDPVAGPVPPRPAMPSVTPGQANATIVVATDGDDEHGESAPEDWAKTRIYATTQPPLEAVPGNSKGAITEVDGETTIGVHAGVWHVGVVWVTESGQESELSETVEVEVEAPVDAQDIQDTLDTAQARLDKYRDEVAAPRFQALEDGLEANTTNLDDARTRLSAAESTLAPLPGRIESAEENVATAQEEATKAAAAAVEANNRAMTRLANGNFESDLLYWDHDNVSLTSTAHSGQQAAQIGGWLRPGSSFPVVPDQIWELSLYYQYDVTVTFETVDGDQRATLSTHHLDGDSTWSDSGTLRVTIPADVHMLSFTITGTTAIVDDITLRDVTDVVRLEEAANANRQKAEQAISELAVLQLAVDGEGGLKDRLASAETVLETKADESALDQLDQKLAGNLAAFESHYTRVWRQPTPPPPGTHYAWLGEPHASESVMLDNDGNELERNLVSAGTFTIGNGVRNGGKITLTKDGTGNPYINLPSAMFVENVHYVFSFKARLVSGEVTRMGGHLAHNYDEQALYRDGEHVGSWHSARDGSGLYDAKIHTYDVLWETITEYRASAVWVQPNRGAYGPDYELELWDFQLTLNETPIPYFDGGTESDRAHDLWYNSDGVPHEWVNGQGWTVLDDQRLGQLAEDIVSAKDAAIAQAATDAQTKADTARADAEATAKTYADLVADGAEEAAIAEADRLHGIAVAAAEAAQARANKAHDEAGTAWTHADAAMNRAVTAESNAIAEARAELAALEIGARNYLLDSEHSPSFSYRSNNNRNYPITTGVEDGVFWISGYQNDNPDNLYMSTYVWETWEAGRGTIYSDNFFPLPELYTQSMEVMSDEPVTVQIGSSETSVTLTPWEWTRISHTQEPIARPLGVSVPDTGIPADTRLYIRHWKLERGSKATDWQPAPEDVQARIDQAKADAQAHADSLPKSLGGTTPPSGTAPDGSVWRQRDSTNTIIARWERINGAWVPQQVSGEVIDNLEAGKITALYTEFAESVIGTIWGQLGVFDRLEAREGWIGGTLLADGAITAEKITATRELITKIMGAEWAYIAERLVVDGDLIANNADIISAAIKNLSVTERADLFEAFITTLSAQEAVIDLLIGTEAWIGGTMLKDDTVTTRHIEFTETLVGNIAELLHLVVDRIDVNSLWADQTWQNAGYFGAETANLRNRTDGRGMEITAPNQDDPDGPRQTLMQVGVFGDNTWVTIDPDTGEVLSNIGSDGAASFQMIDSTTDPTIAGRRLVGGLLDHPASQYSQGILDAISWGEPAYVSTIPDQGPHAAGEVGLLQANFLALPGRQYQIVAEAGHLVRNGTTTSARLRYTSNGLDPDIGSTLLNHAAIGGTGGWGPLNVTGRINGSTNLETGAPVPVRVLLSIQSGAAWAFVGGNGYRDLSIQVLDVGPIRPASGYARNVRSTTGGTPPGVTAYTSAWPASIRANYANQGGYRRTGGTADAYIMQGYDPNTPALGSQGSLIWFNQATQGEIGATIPAAMAGADLESGSLDVYCEYDPTNHSKRARAYWHEYTTTPDTMSVGEPRFIGEFHVPAGGRGRIQLPQSCLDAIKNGTFAGIAFYTANRHQRYALGMSWKYKPNLVLNYQR